MLAYLAGELPNSAKYFSTFGNVCNDDLYDVSKTFGPEPPNAWKPWDYKQRVVTAKKVHVFKTKLNKKPLTEKTKRSKITGFIAGCKSRQEFEPPIGRLIDKAHADPLHVKNNACQLIHISKCFMKQLLNLLLVVIYPTLRQYLVVLHFTSSYVF